MLVDLWTLSSLVLAAAAVVFAILDWIAVARATKPLEYVAKPAVMAFLLIWILVTVGLQGRIAWFAAAIAFSLVGDVLLMLPKPRFRGAIGAFGLAHLSYIVGFHASGAPPAAPVMLGPVLVLAGAGVLLYRALRPGLIDEPDPLLARGVVPYIVVIMLMTLSAVWTLLRPEWPTAPAVLVTTGSVLFLFSDASIAWGRWVLGTRPEAPPPPGGAPEVTSARATAGRLLVITTYHVGQFLLVLGAALAIGGA